MPRTYPLLVILMTIVLAVITSASTAAQDATPPAEELQTYIIQPGDTLLTIARRFNTTVSALVEENNIANPQVIYWGQRIRIPGTESATATVPPGESEQITPTLAEATPEIIEAPQPVPSEPITTFGYGIEVNMFDQDVAALALMVSELGMNWVKQVVYWRDIEPEPGELDFTTLDAIIDALDNHGLQILLTVTAAPDWARSIQEEDGPPDDFALFSDFMSTLAARYAGRVDAYQIWSEPNIRNRWKSTVHPINPNSYIALLRQSQQAVRAADPDALVISAGLAVTGFNDALNAEAGELAVNAVDDRIFLSGMYAEGLADLVDAVGAHPIGWANPPDARCCQPVDGVETHYESPSFYFLHTLEDYRQIQLANNDAHKPIWITRFAWGTSEDLGQPDPANSFTAYTDLLEQAAYTVRAYEIGAASGYVGPMFAYNLNACQAPGRDGFSGCYYSFIGPGNSPRPVFGAVQSMEKIVVTPETPAAELPAETPAAESTEAVIETTPEAEGE